ncbi:inner membrane protein [Pseudomonas fluvialis]|uniref:Inner membrane protein n=1 Tax=Pseudomonas fluvialis TaxID=1793966 RepID=A0A7X0BTM8_9PSED|nr:metal-dependent hydrolase [Pseudomonas fluvialis]MBB6342442.1 inner membrane protein [Pseudomonas fluvialis]
MFIAHLPAGYLLGRSLLRWKPTQMSQTLWLMAALLGAVAPDLDMLYFYLIDQRQHHHHSYWSHWPLLWFSLLGLAVIACMAWCGEKLPRLALLFSLNGCCHLVLDTLVGDIWWLAPWNDKPFALFSVPARFSPWWLNFILHWSFAVELFLWFLSIYAYCHRAPLPVHGADRRDPLE